MSAKLIKDSVTDSTVVNRSLKLPVDNKSHLSQHPKGSILYNVVDNVLYYSNGAAWIPLISGLGNNLIAGPGISIVANGNNITISNTSPASSVTLSSLGGAFPLVPFPETGPALGIMGLNSGTGITLTTDAATEVTVNNSTTLSGTGAGVSLVDVGSPPAYLVKDLIAGSNITLSPVTATSVTINAISAVPPSLVRTLQDFGPQGAGNFVIPAGAIAPRMWASGGGGGGAGGNEVGVGGPGGCGGAHTMQILEPGDNVQWQSIGAGGLGSAGGAAPGAAGNGGDTIVAVNNSPYVYLKGGQGGLNVYLNGSIYAVTLNEPFQGGVVTTTPVYPPHFPAQTAAFPSYLMGYNGGFGNAAGGPVLANGSPGEGVALRSGGGAGGVSTGGSGGGGGGAGGMQPGGAGGIGANNGVNPSTPGSPGAIGGGGGGGGGGGIPPGLPGPSGGGNGGDGIVRVEYWIFTP
jgi:hypothetical protein